jgi:hypothetical protein
LLDPGRSKKVSHQRKRIIVANNMDPNQNLLQALRHPLRRSLLRHSLESTQPLSPKDLEELTENSLSNISYHVQVLVKFGALELACEKPSRGSIQHFYRPVMQVRETQWVLATLELAKEDTK